MKVLDRGATLACVEVALGRDSTKAESRTIVSRRRAGWFEVFLGVYAIWLAEYKQDFD